MTNLKPYPTITTKEVYEIVSESDTKASTTIIILAATTIIIEVAINAVGS